MRFQSLVLAGVSMLWMEVAYGAESESESCATDSPETPAAALVQKVQMRSNLGQPAGPPGPPGPPGNPGPPGAPGPGYEEPSPVPVPEPSPAPLPTGPTPAPVPEPSPAPLPTGPTPAPSPVPDGQRPDGSWQGCGIKLGTLDPLGISHKEIGGLIVNGRDAPNCTWPWQISMVSGDFPFCGGTLISPDWVLTAAHCFTSSLGTNKYGVAGMHNKNVQSGGVVQKIRLVEQRLHPSYGTITSGNDLALVRPETAYQLNECVNPACLPAAGANPAVGSTCWITGWGTLESGGGNPTIHQEASVDIKSNSACNTAYGGGITDDMLCANGQNSDGETTDACQGDSGGPLVCQAEEGAEWVAHGATSWGRGCADPSFPGVWARVAYAGLRDWVAQNAIPPTPTPAPVPTPPPTPAPPGNWEVTGDGCSVDTDTNCLHSLNYPSNYGNQEECSVSFTAVQLSVESPFNTEGRYDKLKLMDGTNNYEFHGSDSSSGDSLSFFGDGTVITGSLTWSSDYSVSKQGWKLCRQDR